MDKYPWRNKELVSNPTYVTHPRVQQMSHSEMILRVHWSQVLTHARKGFKNPGQTSPEVQNRGISETQGRRHQKSRTGVSVKPRADVTRSPKQGYQ